MSNELGQHTALLSLTSHIVSFKTNFDIKSGVKDPELDARFMKDAPDSEVSLTLMSRYKGEFKNLETILVDDQQKYSHTPVWMLTEKALTNVIKMARDDGAKVVILFFPDRGFSYYSKATKKNKNSNMVPAVELKLIQAFAEKQGVEILDMSPALENYVQTLTETSRIFEYPYLKIDGHPSPKGHEIIANEIEQFLKEKFK